MADTTAKATLACSEFTIEPDCLPKAQAGGSGTVVLLVHFNASVGLWLLLLAPILLAIAAPTGLISLPPIGEHAADFLLGVELVVFSFLNARYELLRRWIKRLGWLGQLPLSLDTDSKFGRVYYGSVASLFALVVGLGWTLLPLMLLIRDFSQ